MFGAIRPPHVLMLVENLPVPFDRRVWMQATTLAQAGYDVSVICPQGDYALRYEIVEGVRIYRYPVPSFAGIAGHLLEYAVALPMTFLLTAVVFLRRRPDVIQSANPPDLFFPIGALLAPFGIKFVFDHHDLTPEICESRWTGRRRALLRQLCLWLEWATFRTADRVIATNESYREVALDRGRVAPARVVVVRSAPSASYFRAVAPRPELKNGRAFLVAYLGIMGPNDGVEYLLEAIAHIVHTLGRSDIQFVLIGGGDLQPKLVATSRARGLDAFVRFTGRIRDDELIDLLSTADVGVAPDPKDALNDVSSMNKIVEYMALGKPVVAFDLLEARATAGESGTFVTPNDSAAFGAAIVALLDAPERRRALGELARRRFESTLAWEHQRVPLLQLYHELLR